MTTPTWYRGETIDYVLAVTTDGEPDSLSVATAIELQLKAAPGGSDPALVSLGIGTGITPRAQTGTDIGVADVQIPSAALAAVPAGVYYYDVVVIWNDGTRKYVVKPTKVLVRDVVNAP